MPEYPNWATLDRRNHLVALFIRSGGFCVFGHKNCNNPNHHYELFIEDLITDWKADDKARDSSKWLAERRLLHSLGERRFPIRGQFNNISQDIFFDKQPPFYMLGLGISGLTFEPFAKVRIASDLIVLFVNLGDTLKQASKNQRRKAVRYGKKLPINVKRQINKLISEAVKHYQNR
jgi:hypothetical protein